MDYIRNFINNSFNSEYMYAQMLSEKNEINLSYNNGENSYTDGQNIVIGAGFSGLYKRSDLINKACKELGWDKYNYKQFTTEETMFMINHALLIHECLHIIYTDFPLAVSKVRLPSIEKKLLATIANIIEDAYIEAVASSIMTNIPYYLKFLRTSAGLQSAENVKDNKEEYDKMPKLQRYINYIIAAVLYPTSEIIQPAEDIKEMIEKTLPLYREGALQPTGKKRTEFAKKILSIIKTDEEMQKNLEQPMKIMVAMSEPQKKPPNKQNPQQGKEQRPSQSLFGDFKESDFDKQQNDKQQNNQNQTDKNKAENEENKSDSNQSEKTKSDQKDSKKQNNKHQNQISETDKENQEQNNTESNKPDQKENRKNEADGINGEKQDDDQEQPGEKSQEPEPGEGTCEKDQQEKSAQSQPDEKNCEENKKTDKQQSNQQQSNQNDDNAETDNEQTSDLKNPDSNKTNTQNNSENHKQESETQESEADEQTDNPVQTAGRPNKNQPDKPEESKQELEAKEAKRLQGFLEALKQELTEAKNNTISEKVSAEEQKTYTNQELGVKNKCKILEQKRQPLKAHRPAYEATKKLNLHTINLYKNKFARLIKARTTALVGGNKYGIGIDSSRLGDVKKRYWTKHSETIDAPDLAVQIIIDGSGSMRGRKQINAVNATVILHEILEAHKITHAIAEHREQNKIEINNLLDFNHKPNDKYSLMYINANGCNYDGVALMWGAKRLKHRPEKHKIIIIISDGLPCYDDTKQCVDKITKSGIKTIAIGLGMGIADSLKQYYKNIVDCSTAEQLPKKLAETISKLLK